MVYNWGPILWNPLVTEHFYNRDNAWANGFPLTKTDLATTAAECLSRRK